MLKKTSHRKKSFLKNESEGDPVNTLKKYSSKNRTSTMGHVEDFETQETVHRMTTNMRD